MPPGAKTKEVMETEDDAVFDGDGGAGAEDETDVKMDDDETNNLLRVSEDEDNADDPNRQWRNSAEVTPTTPVVSSLLRKSKMLIKPSF